ncbi:hypothetical protein WJX73_001896 [Symbiochloris irregularis]|uniref:NAD(P)H dehydrogenase (quinone) n=1 Tax=Symbiochloris irregularis TaxID=706552 RepID=A0AAW1P9Y9_9CHLO
MAPGSGIKILGISGSLRKASLNTGLLRSAEKAIPEGVEFTIADISGLPMLNQDLEGKGPNGVIEFPEVVEAWRKQVAGADAILFSSPEYNYGLTAALKNAIDWASRPPNAWDDKPAAIVGAGGGVKAYQSNRVLRLSGIFLNLHFINKPETQFAIRDPGLFDWSTGDLLTEEGNQRVADTVTALVAWTKRLQQ